MGRIIVNVMPNPDSVAEESKKLVAELSRAGVERLTSVRPGRRYYLYVEGEATEADLVAARHAVERLIDPAHFAITGVFIGGAHLAATDDDWDAFEEGIGAIAPIQPGMGKTVPPRPSRRSAIDMSHLGDLHDENENIFGTDDDDRPASDPTWRY